MFLFVVEICEASQVNQIVPSQYRSVKVSLVGGPCRSVQISAGPSGTVRLVKSIHLYSEKSRCRARLLARRGSAAPNRSFRFSPITSPWRPSEPSLAVGVDRLSRMLRRRTSSPRAVSCFTRRSSQNLYSCGDRR